MQPDGGLSAPLQTIATEAPVLAAAQLGAGAGELAGALLLATHEDRTLSRAHLAVEGLDSVLLVLPRCRAGEPGLFVDPGKGRRQALNLTERVHDPLVGLDALAIDPATGALAVVGAGTDNVVVVAHAGAPSLLDADARRVGANPVATTFLPDGRLVTADRLSDTLSFLDSVGTARGTVTVSVGEPQRPSPAERGELLFYSRALVPHNVADGPLSVYTCAACHPDGQIDGRRHPSKRNRFFSMTKTCRGLVGTEPFLSLGKPGTFAAFADNIVATHAQGALDAPATFDRYPVDLRLRVGAQWTTATLSPAGVRAALAAYLAEIPVEPSPFVPPGRRTLAQDERRGLAVFRQNCAGCHQLVRSTDRERAIPAGELEQRLLAGQVALTSPAFTTWELPCWGRAETTHPHCAAFGRRRPTSATAAPARWTRCWIGRSGCRAVHAPDTSSCHRPSRPQRGRTCWRSCAPCRAGTGQHTGEGEKRGGAGGW